MAEAILERYTTSTWPRCIITHQYKTHDVAVGHSYLDRFTYAGETIVQVTAGLSTCFRPMALHNLSEPQPLLSIHWTVNCNLWVPLSNSSTLTDTSAPLNRLFRKGSNVFEVAIAICYGRPRLFAIIAKPSISKKAIARSRELQTYSSGSCRWTYGPFPKNNNPVTNEAQRKETLG